MGFGVVVVGSAVEDVGEDVDGLGVIAGLGVGRWARQSPSGKLVLSSQHSSLLQ